MAARRLLAAMLVFLAISTVLAALAPRPTDPENETTTATKTTTALKRPPPAGRLVHRLVRLNAQAGELRAEPDSIAVQEGDQLVLEVAAPRVLTLELASLGVTETAGPDDPARIDLFLDTPGRHVVRNAATGRRLVRIDVQNRQRKPTREGQTGGSNP